MTRRHSWRRTAGLVAAGVVAALVASGCSSSSREASPASAPDRGKAAQPAQDNANAAQPAGAPAQAGGAAAQAPPQGNAAQAPTKVVPDDRAIVYTGTMNVQVSKVDEQANAAATIVQGARGFVGGDNRTINDSHKEARLVLRVPAAEFYNVLGRLSGLGEEVSRSVSTEDVTEQVADINSRVTTAQASVERVRALLARAQNLGEIVTLEAEVAKREAELESLKARQRKLADLTALSTITLVLATKDAPPVVKKAKKPDSGFVAGLKSGWRSFTASLEVLLQIVGALLPWLVALALPVALVLWLLRRGPVRSRPVHTAPAASVGNDEEERVPVAAGK
jgi:hypothetical protein